MIKGATSFISFVYSLVIISFHATILLTIINIMTIPVYRLHKERSVFEERYGQSAAIVRKLSRPK